MAGNMWGADVAELRTLAQQFGKASDTLLNQSTLLNSQINNNPFWKGEDAARFRSDWNGGHRALLQRTASALKQESKKLLENANEQEKASNGAPGSGGGLIPGVSRSGGPAGSGSASPANPWGPDWLAKGSPFRNAWGLRGQIKAGLDLPKNLIALRSLGENGWDALKSADALKLLREQNTAYRYLDTATDFVGLKNLNTYLPGLNRFSGFFEESTLLFKGQGPTMEALGKGGLARGLGWLGVGLNGFDTVKHIAEGNTGDAVWSGAKTALGVGCFLPPPAGTVCQVASVGIAIYEIPAVKSFVDGAAKDAGEIVAKRAVESAAFVAETGKNLADMGKSAANFLGIG